MGIALVIIEKEHGGERFANTHAVKVGNTTGILSDAEMTAIGAGSDLSASTTAPAFPTHNFLQAVLSFERQMMHPSTTFKGLYLSDGKRNFNAAGAAEPRSFWTSALDFPGLLAVGEEPIEMLAPGAITLLLARNPAGFSQRKGRIFLRTAVLDSWVKVAGPKMIDWQTPGISIGVAAQVQDKLTTSDLRSFMDSAGTPGDIQYGIPHYLHTEPQGPQEGNLLDVTPCVGLTVIGPSVRQVKRGRKERD